MRVSVPTQSLKTVRSHPNLIHNDLTEVDNSFTKYKIFVRKNRDHSRCNGWNLHDLPVLQEMRLLDQHVLVYG